MHMQISYKPVVQAWPDFITPQNNYNYNYNNNEHTSEQLNFKFLFLQFRLVKVKLSQTFTQHKVQEIFTTNL